MFIYELRKLHKYMQNRNKIMLRLKMQKYVSILSGTNLFFTGQRYFIFATRSENSLSHNCKVDSDWQLPQEQTATLLHIFARNSYLIQTKTPGNVKYLFTVLRTTHLTCFHEDSSLAILFTVLYLSGKQRQLSYNKFFKLTVSSLLWAAWIL
jgi:hypothetical protein